LSVSEDRTVQPTPTTAVTLPGPADPGPLGLAAFALTTFLLSASNANWMTHATGGNGLGAWLGFALAYGGLAQLLAAMWEYRNRNVFGATAFGTFGAFWIGLGIWYLQVLRPAVAVAILHPLTLPATVSGLHHDLGWILLGFAIFTTYLLILATGTNLALFATILLLWAALIILMAGNFYLGSAQTSGIIQVGGYVGVATALAAWYTSWAGMAAFMGHKVRIPVGAPLLKP